MAVADQFVIIIDVIFRQIPLAYYLDLSGLMQTFRVCNIHIAFLQAATDCSVWFTVIFTFDRFVAICCGKLKIKYCTVKTATVTLGTLTVLDCIKNIFWCFIFTGKYMFALSPWTCIFKGILVTSPFVASIEFLYYILTPCIRLLLILILNVCTVSHILVSSRFRRRLQAHSQVKTHKDPEMESRMKSIILLFALSANFILLWAILLFVSIQRRMLLLRISNFQAPIYLLKLGFMLQLLSCCTNTVIYGLIQAKFRQQMKDALKYPFTRTAQFIK